MYNIEQVPPINTTMSWYVDIQKKLEHNTLPLYLSIKHKREICLKALSYQLVHGVIFWKHHNGALVDV